jgi:hypothetical protein
MKKIFFFVVLNAVFVLGIAQNEVQNSAIQTMEHTAKSPNTASLSKYFEVPVNLSSGVPNISIPLYTVKSGNITLPIVLNYHAGGVKVNDLASWVGLGWSLNFGGVVTKKTNGLDDYHSNVWTPSSPPGAQPTQHNYFDPVYDIDANTGIVSITDLIDTTYTAYGMSNANDINHILGRITQGRYDGEADQYFFSTPEKSGMIFYDQRRQKFLGDKIDGWSFSMATNNDGSWEIRNTTGISYGYGAAERTLSPFYAPGSRPSQDYYNSAWYLSQVTDLINSKVINIDYNTSATYWKTHGQSEWIEYDLGTYYYRASSNEPIYHQGNDITLRQITYDEGTIQFVQDAATRLDDNTAPKALTEIRVYDVNNHLKKKFLLSYFYQASRLFLKSVQELNYIDSSLSNSTPYLFNYDTTIALPARFSYAQDFYGYYNGRTSNTTNIPSDQYSSAFGLTGFANRYIDTNYTRAGMLKQIVYPSGGTLNLEFESNRDDYDTLSGGVRIKRVINVDSVAGKKLIKEYKYYGGYQLHKPKFGYLYSYMSNMYTTGVIRLSGSPNLPLTCNQGSPMFYPIVDELQVSDTTKLKVRHHFLDYFQYGPDLPSYYFEAGVPYDKYPNVESYRSLEYKTEVFRYKNGAYSRMKVDSSEFISLNQFRTYIWNVQTAWSMLGEWIVWAGNDPYSQTTMNSFPRLNLYKFFQESVVNNISYSKEYDDLGGLLEQASFKTYNSLNGQIKTTTTINSKGDTLRTYFKYSGDLPWTNSSNNINQEANYLFENGFTGLPIEIIQTRKPAAGTEIVIGGKLMLYDHGKIKKEYRLKPGSTYAALTKFYLDDNGAYFSSDYELESEVAVYSTTNKPLQVNTKAGTSSLIWQGDNLTATVTNAAAVDIAATSFETSETGNWSYSGTTNADASSPTGLKAYSLGGGSLSKGSLSSSKAYTVSYWSKNGSYLVTGSASVKQGKTVDGWTYYEHEVAGTTSVTISGTGYIDEVRLHPKTAMMVTNTYVPLLGISSQCDANNRISYYEYDSFGRLRRVKDQDKSVIKVIDYKYQTSVQN